MDSSRKYKNREYGQPKDIPIAREQPKDLETEKIVLGALLIDKEAINKVIDILSPDNFYDPRHQAIYQSAQDLFAESEPIDLRTVIYKLRQNGTYLLVGESHYVMHLTTLVYSDANIEKHARIVLEMAIRREMIKIFDKISYESFELTHDVFELLDEAQQNLFDISEKNIRKNYADMKTIMALAIKDLESKKDRQDGLTGVPAGFTALDRVTAGWQKSDLIILAARPAMGKTAFCLSVLRNAAVDHQMPVAIFSLEMSSLQLMNRLIAAEAKLDSEKLKTGNFTADDWDLLTQKTTLLSNAAIFVDDTPALSVLELRAKCRRLKAQNDIQLIVIDYLQLMSGNTGKGGNREQEIASISRALKQIAKELDVPVIALSQLSRAVETRGGDKRPQLSDLRESGSIEQDADMVLFLYRPEYYGIDEDMDGNPTKGVGEVIVAKHRNGMLGTVKLRFIGKYTRFEDLDAPTDTGENSFDYSYSNSFQNATIPHEFGTITLGSKMNELPNADFKNETGNDDVPF